MSIFRCVDCGTEFKYLIGLESHVEYWKQNDDEMDFDD